MISFVLALAVVSHREHWPQAALLTLMAVEPRAAAVLVAGLILRARRAGDRGMAAEIGFHQHIVSELRGGSALRTAIASAAAGSGGLGMQAAGRHLAAGLPIDQIAEAIGSRLPATGALAAAAIEFSVRSGGRALDAFAAMAEMATEEAAVQRELATAAAPGQFALLVVGGGPIVALIVLAMTGRLAILLATTHGPVLVAVGLGLIMAGVGVAAVLSRAALR